MLPLLVPHSTGRLCPTLPAGVAHAGADGGWGCSTSLHIPAMVLTQSFTHPLTHSLSLPLSLSLTHSVSLSLAHSGATLFICSVIHLRSHLLSQPVTLALCSAIYCPQALPHASTAFDADQHSCRQIEWTNERGHTCMHMRTHTKFESACTIYVASHACMCIPHQYILSQIHCSDTNQAHTATAESLKPSACCSPISLWLLDAYIRVYPTTTPPSPPIKCLPSSEPLSWNAQLQV